MRKKSILFQKKEVAGLIACLFLGACVSAYNISQTPIATVLTASSTATLTIAPPVQPTQTLFPDPNLPPWQHNLPPSQAPIIPIPYPMAGIWPSTGIHAMILLGSDENSPFVGRTDAILLILYSPENRRATLLSIPPDLMVYIPGFTMQRLNIAYAVGGGSLLIQTIEYNFGVRPEHWVLAHPNEFASFIDTLGGLDLQISRDIPDVCGGIKAGTVHLNGERTLCFAHSRTKMEENDRSSRQILVMRALLRRLAQGGKLALLPDFFDQFGNLVESDLSLTDLEQFVPLFLFLAEPGQVQWLNMDENQVEVKELPGKQPVKIFLPQADAVRAWMQKGLNFLKTPAPESLLARTLAAEITTSPTPTSTFTPSPTNTRTPSPYPTITRTRTPTPEHSPTNTLAPTWTRTSTATSTATATENLLP
jgi:polyisoprenyl-teichoic acid--peptidoglycan teichoic acid transferase